MTFQQTGQTPGFGSAPAAFRGESEIVDEALHYATFSSFCNERTYFGVGMPGKLLGQLV